MSVIRSFWLISAVFGFGLIASGCSSGGGHSGPVVQNPVVRPKTLGPPGECYYVTSPAECTNQGERGVPTPMPPLWLATYWPYYASTNYAMQVPLEDEDQYAQDLGTFAANNSTMIADDESDGQWVDQDGNSWDGDSSEDPDAAGADDSGGDDSGGDDSGDDSNDDSDGDDGGDDGGDDD
jgi:hypothetical protein